MEKKEEYKLEDSKLESIMSFLTEYMGYELKRLNVGYTTNYIAVDYSISYHTEYDSLTIFDYLTLYKLNYLKKNNMIDEETAAMLLQTFNELKDLDAQGSPTKEKDFKELTKEEKEAFHHYYGERIKREKILESYHLLTKEDEILEDIQAGLKMAKLGEPKEKQPYTKKINDNVTVTTF